MTAPDDERSGAKGPTLRYRALVRLLSPLLLGHLVVRASRDGGVRYLRERLGFAGSDARDEAVRGERHSGTHARPRDSPQDGSHREPGADPCSGRHPGAPRERPLWVHAASVGEVMTVLPLVRGALEGGDTRTVLVTTNTPTGATVLARHAPPGVRHRYLPLDFPGATRRFLVRERPTRGWIVETEVWPWLYARCRAHGVPLAIVNARLSPRTARHANGPLATTYRRALAGVDVFARSTADAAGYRTLGADAARVRTVGELKLADGGRASGTGGPPRTPAPLDRPYALAASTHDDEELRLARAWLGCAAEGLLVIAPRHPERGPALARQLPGTARRALGESPAPGARLFLADTLGELDDWYAHARGAFVGGSLIERGGHNVLEPARHGCPIVVGPHTANFAAPVAMLREAGAIAVVGDAAAAAAFLARALSPDETVRRQGARAREAVNDAGRAVVSAYLDALGALDRRESSVRHPLTAPPDASPGAPS